MNELAELIESFRSESDGILERVKEFLLLLDQSPAGTDAGCRSTPAQPGVPEGELK